MNFDEQFPRRTHYLYGADLDGKNVTATIEKVEFEEMRHPRDKKAMVKRAVLYFVDHAKGLILTQDADDDDGQEQTPACRQLIAVHGPRSENWSGKMVELYPESGEAFGKPYCAVRIRAAKPDSAPSAPAKPAAPPVVLTPSQEVFGKAVAALFPAGTEKAVIRQAVTKAGRRFLNEPDWDGNWTELMDSQLTGLLSMVRSERPGASEEPPPDDIPFF